MPLKNIYFKIKADKSISLDLKYNVYQGEANTYRLVIDTSLIANDLGTIVKVGFKRADNRLTDYLSCSRQPDGTYVYNMKSPWFFNIVGKLWITIQVCKQNVQQTEYVLYAGNTFFQINPIADYNLDSDLPPSAEVLLQEQIDELSDKKLDKDFTEYTTYNWEDLDDDEYVAINKNVDGVMTVGKAKLQDLYNRVNDIAPVDGNISLDASDIPYDDSDVATTLDECVYHSDLEDEEPVYDLYEVISITQNPTDIIYTTDSCLCVYNISPIYKYARLVTISFNYNLIPSAHSGKRVVFRLSYGENDYDDLTAAYNSKDRVINTSNTYYEYVFIRTAYVSDFVCSNPPRMKKTINVYTRDWAQYSQGIYTCNFPVPEGTTIFPYTVTITKTNANTSETQVLADYIISGNRIYIYYSSIFDGKIKIFE